MNSYVALASSKKELEKVLQFAEENANAKLACICQGYWPDSAVKEKNVELFKEKDFLSEEEIYKIDEKSLFFSRNWYKFDKSFEKAIEFKEIQIGFASSFEIIKIFHKIFLLLKSASNAVAGKKAVAIIASKNSFSGKCAKIAAAKANTKFIALELQKEKVVDMWSNISIEKLQEVGKKLGKIILEGARFRKKTNAKIVFVKSNGYLGELSKKIQEDKELQLVSLDNFVIKKMLNPAVLLRCGKIRSEKKALFARAFNKFRESRLFAEKMVFEGMSFADAFSECMPRFIEKDWTEFAFVIEILSKEFEKQKPEVVVLWEDMVPFERICALLAKKNKTKSLVVQHGLFKPRTKVKDWLAGFAPLTADKIAVWGPIHKRMLMKKQVPENRIVITGSPRFDPLLNRKFDDKGFRKKLGLKKGEKLVVLATQPYTVETTPPAVLAENVLKAVKAIPKARMAIKIHPLERRLDYKKMLEREGNHVTLLEKTDLHQLLHCADTVIVFSSTVGIEAMLLGKPVIVYADKLLEKSVYKEFSKSLIARNMKQVRLLLEKILQNSLDKEMLKKEIEKFVYDNAFKQDGKASQRIIEEIKRGKIKS